MSELRPSIIKKAGSAPAFCTTKTLRTLGKTNSNRFRKS